MIYAPRITMIARRLFALAALGLLCPALAAAQGTSPIIPGGNAKGPISITAPSLDYLDKERRLVYSGGVVAKQGDATLRASSLTIVLNGSGGSLTQAAPTNPEAGGLNAAGGNQIARIEAAGPVSVVSKDEVGTGDSGVYDRAANKLTLNGNVSLSKCGNVLKGARLVYDLTTGRAQVQGGVTSLFTPGANCGGQAGGRADPPQDKPKPPPPTPATAPRPRAQR